MVPNFILLNFDGIISLYINLLFKTNYKTEKMFKEHMILK